MRFLHTTNQFNFYSETLLLENKCRDALLCYLYCSCLCIFSPCHAIPTFLYNFLCCFLYLCKQHTHDFDIVAHAHLLHPVRAGGLINQLAKKLVTSLAISPVKCLKAISAEQYLPRPWQWLWSCSGTTSMTMTLVISSRESRFLANCSPLHHCHLFFVQSIQEARDCASS